MLDVAALKEKMKSKASKAPAKEADDKISPARMLIDAIHAKDEEAVKEALTLCNENE